MLKKFVIALIAASALTACGQNAQSEGAEAASQEVASTEPAQAGGECQSLPGRPNETLERAWTGEFVIEATPGTTTCGPIVNSVVTCTVRGPARVWADGDSYASHSVVPEGQSATYTLSASVSRCELNAG